MFLKPEIAYVIFFCGVRFTFMSNSVKLRQDRLLPPPPADVHQSPLKLLSVQNLLILLGKNRLSSPQQ